jgi:hypothetical protein
VHRRADANFFVATFGARFVVIERDATHRCIDQDLGAIALLVRVVEKLGDDDALFVGDVRAGEGDAVENPVVLIDRCVFDPVLTDDAGVEIR